MHTPRILAAAISLTALSCGKAASEAPAPAGSGSASVASADVVARVNGAPITQQDVRLKLKSDTHAAAAKPNLDSVLDTVIREELAAQRAAELGLDADPKYREGLRQVEAQVAAYRRRALSDLFWERSVEKSAAPSEADAKRYFDEHQKEIRTQVHVKQILRRGEAAIEEVRRKLDAGQPFDEVAAALFPTRPPQTTPWDLGYLSWYKLPEPWRAVVPKLADGQVSAVIRGPNERAWIIQVVSRREDAETTFEAARGAIMADLARVRVEEAREKAARALRERARVERIAAPTAAPAAPLEE